MPRESIRIDQQSERVTFPEVTVADRLVAELFRKAPEERRLELYERALRIGAYACLEDRIGTFLASTRDEVGAQLEYLKLLYDTRRVAFTKSPTDKGRGGEEVVLEALRTFVAQRKWTDTLANTADHRGELPGNKTGDIVATVPEAGGRRIVVEVKFDKSVPLGAVEDRTVFNKTSADTAWSQLVEAAANRDGVVAVIVFDRATLHASVARAVSDVALLPEAGLVAVVDAASGDFRNAAVAYGIARSMLLATARGVPDMALLRAMIQRVIVDLKRAVDAREHADRIIEAAHALVEDLHKSRASLEVTLEFLQRVAETGGLSRAELLDFYRAEPARERLAAVAREMAEAEAA